LVTGWNYYSSVFTTATATYTVATTLTNQRYSVDGYVSSELLPTTVGVQQAASSCAADLVKRNGYSEVSFVVGTQNFARQDGGNQTFLLCEGWGPSTRSATRVVSNKSRGCAYVYSQQTFTQTTSKPYATVAPACPTSPAPLTIIALDASLSNRPVTAVWTASVVTSGVQPYNRRGNVVMSERVGFGPIPLPEALMSCATSVGAQQTAGNGSIALWYGPGDGGFASKGRGWYCRGNDMTSDGDEFTYESIDSNQNGDDETDPDQTIGCAYIFHEDSFAVYN